MTIASLWLQVLHVSAANIQLMTITTIETVVPIASLSLIIMYYCFCYVVIPKLSFIHMLVLNFTGRMTLRVSIMLMEKTHLQ